MCGFFKRLFRKNNDDKIKVIVTTPVFNYDISSNSHIIHELPPPYKPLIT